VAMAKRGKKGRTSKVVEYELEHEVIELLKKGLGPKVIADTLNKRHNLAKPLNHVNIIAFRDTLPLQIYQTIKEEHLQEFYVKPLERLRSEMNIIREHVFPELVKAIEIADTRKIRVLERAFMDTWDRIAKMEDIINPTGEMKAKVIHIQQQFNLFKDHIDKTFSKLCPECRAMVLAETENKTTPIIIDAEVIDETPHTDTNSPVEMQQ